MTPREIVLKTIRFEGPERIAMSLPAPYPNDIAWGGIAAGRNWEEAESSARLGGSRWKDEWGNTWARVDQFSMGQVVEGALRDWSQVDGYQMPAFDDPTRYEAAKASFARQADMFKIGGLPGFPFAIMRYLRRMDIFLEDLLTHPAEVRRFADRVTDLLTRCIEQWALAGADAVEFAEDWGTQERLLVSPRMWREVFKPDYAKLCEAARRNGLSVWMHSCGYIWDIIEDLIECGVAVLQMDQPGLFGIDRLAEAFGGRISFECPVDIQQVLPTGDEKRIEAFARELVHRLGRFGGGFVAGFYGDMRSIGVQPEWQDIACRAFVKYGTL
jgi:hypothetical protein